MNIKAAGINFTLYISNQDTFKNRSLMNKESKGKWIAALRSGKFKQIKGFLKTKEGYCCLGVKAEIDGCIYSEDKEAFNIKGTLHREILGYGINGDYEDGLESSGCFIGFYLQNEHGNGFSTLASLNDRGYSFEVIADIIEQLF